MAFFDLIQRQVIRVSSGECLRLLLPLDRALIHRPSLPNVDREGWAAARYDTEYSVFRL